MELSLLYWLHNRPSSRTFPLPSGRMRRGSNDTLAKHFGGFRDRLVRTHAAGLRTYRPRPWVKVWVLEVSVLFDVKLVVGPEGVVEGEVAVFIRVVSVEESCHVAHHIDAETAVEGGLSLVEGTHSDSYFHTHSKTIIKHQI